MFKQTYVCKVCKKRWGISKCVLKVGIDDFPPDRCPYNEVLEEAKWKKVDEGDVKNV